MSQMALLYVSGMTRVGAWGWWWMCHFCGRGKTPAEAVEDIVHIQLPRLQEKMTKGELQVDNIDVFCEKGVFDLHSTRTILQAGKDMGLQLNFHGDELHPMNSAQVDPAQLNKCTEHN